LSPFGVLGEKCFQRRKIEQAIHYFHRALAAGEDPGRHSFQRWACWMLLGDFEKAWQESDRVGTSFSAGDPFKSRRILINCLRGLGDAIQFLRYVPQLRNHCEVLDVQAPARLLPLIALMPAIDGAFELGQPLPADYDCCIECSDLPYLFRTTTSTIPPETKILLPSRSNAHQDFAHRVKVGIVWEAGCWNPSRSIPLHLLLSCTRINDLEVFSLQRNPVSSRLHNQVETVITELETDHGTLVDTAQFIRELDLVISVDTMVAHLAGSLGVPVWVLLEHAADWRWMLDRTDSPWYSSMKLFRQSSAGDWPSVVNELTSELSEMCKSYVVSGSPVIPAERAY
jgi:hypothetical protein